MRRAGDVVAAAHPPRLVETQAFQAAALALIAGYVDAYGLIRYATYASFMSGNTTQTGSRIGRWDLAQVGPPLTAIVCFVAGVFAGAWLEHSGGGPLGSRRVRYGAVAALLAVAAALDGAGVGASEPGIALLSVAMGTMTTTLSRVGAQSVSVGYVTGVLSALATHLALAARRVPLDGAIGPWDTHGRRALQLGGVWLALLLGAMASGAASHFLEEVTLLPAILVLLGFAAFGSGEPSPRPTKPGIEGVSP